MKNLKLIILLLMLTLIFSFGCSHAGPYVSKITPTAVGLTVEKCYVDFYYITGNISTGVCSTEHIDLRK